MDEIEKRLGETSEACLKHYKVWQADKKSSEARANIMEAAHELRKVCARLEIEMAVSEREEMTSKPIPIPSHRSSGRGGGNNNEYSPGNSISDGGGRGPSRSGGGQRRKKPSPKSSSSASK